MLSLRGAQVVLGVRNIAAGEMVKEQIMKEQSHARLHVLRLDLASIASVRQFCQDFQALNLRLNILINSAGVMGCPFSLSEDGIEMQFATNHVGHFLLTTLLLDNMKSTAKETGIQGRIVNISSWGHKFSYSGGIRFDKLNDKASYSFWHAYGQSKLANILHAKELARQFQEEGVNLTVNAVHPGAILTNISRHLHRQHSCIIMLKSIFLKSIPQGAATQCFVALHPSIIGASGMYFVNCKIAQPSTLACDPKLSKDLCDFTENLVSLKSDLQR